MSMFNAECICMDCATAERKRADYREAVEDERNAVQSGNRNYPGIDNVKCRHSPVE